MVTEAIEKILINRVETMEDQKKKASCRDKGVVLHCWGRQPLLSRHYHCKGRSIASAIFSAAGKRRFG